MTIPHSANKKKTSDTLQKKEINYHNEIYEKVMNDYGDITRFTNMTEAERMPKNGYWYGFGKRKKARASAFIKPGSGVVTINGKPAHKYLQHPSYRGKMYVPLVMTGNSATLDIKIIVFGGGISGQMDAILPAIAKALVQMNPDYIERFAKCEIYFLIFLFCFYFYFFSFFLMFLYFFSILLRFIYYVFLK